MSGTNWGPFRMVQAGGEYATVLAKACSTANVRGFRNLDPDQRREVLEKLADEAEQLVNDLATLGKAKPPAPDVRKGRIRSVEDMTFEER